MLAFEQMSDGDHNSGVGRAPPSLGSSPTSMERTEGQPLCRGEG